MPMRIHDLFFWLFLCYITGAHAQNPAPFVSHPTQLEDAAFAEWIVPDEDLGVFYFRKGFDLDAVPQRFVVHVSADVRYRLYVNGQLVCWGPAVGDVENWFYETADIAAYLQPGRNVVAAQVWNWGRLNGTRHQSVRTGFILQGDSPTEHIINTGESWKVMRDAGYYVLEMTDAMAGGGFIAGGTDSLVASKHPWGWMDVAFDDGHWEHARAIGKGNHAGLDTWKGTVWKLRPRQVPFMEERDERIPRLLSVQGMPFPQVAREQLRISVPANSRVEILLDNRVLTMGFPQLHVSGGQGSQIRVQYQEAMFDADGRKRNRNEWEGMAMKGIYDVFMPDGADRLFEPLWIRVFRYVKLAIETGDDPLVIEDFYNRYTAYPLEQKAFFDAGDEVMRQIWDASWRTARLCALETYMDCPYYEQVQYIGDTRIQALISMVVAGDSRMAANAIEQFYNSMQPMGLTKSAHPTDGVQIIPPFSLVFIGMIHDYYMLTDDQDFIRSFIPGIRFILEWFIARIGDDGVMGPLPYWNHVDGGTEFVNGSPPGISDGGSIHMTILLAYALDKANELLRVFGFDCDEERFGAISDRLKQAAMTHGYCDERRLIAETPARQQFSQHTNIFAILTDTYEVADQQDIARRITTDDSLIQTTLYFKFYLFQALKKTGLGHLVLDLMDEWKVFLDHGFTTFPEHGIYSRSDCHAWSAHPMLAYLTIITGIEPASPGFSEVRIQPAMGDLEEIQGSMPHVQGEISFHYQKLPNRETMYRVVLPGSLTGSLLVNGESYSLMPGENVMTIK